MQPFIWNSPHYSEFRYRSKAACMKKTRPQQNAPHNILMHSHTLNHIFLVLEGPASSLQYILGLDGSQISVAAARPLQLFLLYPWCAIVAPSFQFLNKTANNWKMASRHHQYSSINNHSSLMPIFCTLSYYFHTDLSPLQCLLQAIQQPILQSSFKLTAI